jgi:alkaline phosphatase D
VILTAMNRRDFLRLSGTFFAVASLGGLAACSDDSGPATDAGIDAPTAGTFLFPQGLGSGDPRETSVVLWTRVRADASGTRRRRGARRGRERRGFATIVVMQMVSATAASDHTVRVVVTGLAADTIYYYRFTAGTDVADRPDPHRAGGHRRPADPHGVGELPGLRRRQVPRRTAR